MKQIELAIVPPAPPPARAALPPPPPYTVRLQESELAMPDRIKLEARFCRALEGNWASQHHVAAMLTKLQDAEFQEHALTPEEKTWARAGSWPTLPRARPPCRTWTRSRAPGSMCGRREPCGH